MNNYMDEVIKIVDLTQNRPLNEIIYEGLRRAIILGVIPAGSHINEKGYAASMNISRTPIRHAIEKLKSENLIEYIPNYGVVVKKVTIGDAEEIYKIRKVLDTLAATTAMKLMDEEDYKKMQRFLTKANLADDLGDADAVIAASTEFNSLVYKFAKMPKLIVVVGQLQEYLSRFRNISLYEGDRRSEALHEHVLIYQAMKAGDRDLLVDIIDKHLDSSKSFVIQEILRFEKELEESKVIYD